METFDTDVRAAIEVMCNRASRSQYTTSK